MEFETTIATKPHTFAVGDGTEIFFKHDRRGHGRSRRRWTGNNLDTYAVSTVNKDQLNADPPGFIKRA